MDSSVLCNLFYASHFLPIALYEDDRQLLLCSPLDQPLSIHFAALPSLRADEQNPAVYSSPDAGLYGRVRIQETGRDLVIGPVFSVRLTEDSIAGFMRSNAIAAPHRDDIAAFLGGLPRYSYNQFLNLLAFLHLEINGTGIDVIEHFHLSDTQVEQEIAVRRVQQSAAEETVSEHGTYRFEQQMLDMVRRGEPDKLEAFLNAALQYQALTEGTLADNPLRQAKNVFIGMVTMVGKYGAIPGGLDVEETYHLIDLYIQECEKAQSEAAIKTLQYNALFDFTERVGQSKIPPNLSREVYAALQFIRSRTNSKTSIDEVAAHVGKSRAWITRRFREELNQSIGEASLQAKLQDAKSLLRHSDRSLSDISAYLCFHSQSYFQSVFKKAFGMTPTEYRKKQKIIE